MFLAVGGEEGKVRLFNIRKQTSTSDGKKTPLRIFKAHESAVHTVSLHFHLGCFYKRIFYSFYMEVRVVLRFSS